MIAELFSSIIDVSWTTSDLIEQVNIPQILAGEHKFASNLKDVEQNRIVTVEYNIVGSEFHILSVHSFCLTLISVTSKI